VAGWRLLFDIGKAEDVHYVDAFCSTFTSQSTASDLGVKEDHSDVSIESIRLHRSGLDAIRTTRLYADVNPLKRLQNRMRL
jgi:hypothetical protein